MNSDHARRIVFRSLAMAAQFGVLLVAYWQFRDTLDLYINSLFLSTIGLTVTKAGANFVALRAPTATGAAISARLSPTIGLARIAMGLAATLLATQIQGVSHVALAAFMGVAFGLAHNEAYAAFLRGTRFGDIAISLFGFAHFACVLTVLVTFDTSYPVPQGVSIILVLALAVALFLRLLHSVASLAIGELAYSYAYPLFVYSAASGLAGHALWLYFLITKIVDAASILLFFVFQPRFFKMSTPGRQLLAAKLSRAFSWATLALIALAIVLIAMLSGVQYEHIANAAIVGLSISVMFMLTAIGGFMLVCMTESVRIIMLYGVALLVGPLVGLAGLEAVGMAAFGPMAGLAVVWCINQVALGRYLRS